MKYWIFVVTGEDAPNILQRLFVLKNWGFWINGRIRKKVEALRKGDVVVFYVGGMKGKYLAGEAKLTSGLCKPTRESINMPERGRLGGMVEFGDINEWGGNQLHLTAIIRTHLDFIKNKSRWGATFRQSILPITKEDYVNIKNLLTKK